MSRKLGAHGRPVNLQKNGIMALVYEGIKCPLCGDIIDLKSRYVATTHFIADQNDPLWRYSDAAMHYGCFQNWEHRTAFVAKYNDSIGQIIWGNGTRHQMQKDGTIEVVRGLPDGYRSITPYLKLPNCGRLIEFLKQAFGAVEKRGWCGRMGRCCMPRL